jgi:hypothetical protein
VALSKRKMRRNPLQLLSDQRRSLALAGLAVGAVVGAAVFRRKRRGEEDEFVSTTVQFEENIVAMRPDPEAPAAPVDSGPPPAVEVPPAATEPELEEAPQPINAAPSAPAEPGPAEVEPAPLEPATGELSAEEASILSVLAQSGRSDDDRTAIAVATSLERDTAAVTDVLRKLGAEGVVSGELYTAGGDKIWAVTERGVRRLGAQS